jgi:hypothetical protein
MKRRFFPLFALVVATAGLAACASEKSSNPLSPSVAGPIPGVSITTPKLLEPLANQAIPGPEQPVTLLIENASSNGERPVTYLFEIATDLDFNGKVFTREGIAPGSGGRTSLKLPDALATDRTYYWRARATDGANSSNFTGAAAFAVVTPAVLEAPQPLSPVGATTISSRRAELLVRNSARSGPIGGVYYVFEIALNETFVSPIAVVTVPEQVNQTRLALALDLEYSTKYMWRVRSYDPNAASNWSLTQSFRTPEAPVIVTPTPAPPTSPAPSGAWPKNGDELVAWATRNYSNRLVAGVSLSQRQANMAYVRDRMIEGGICGGMDLAWNLKRGGPELSIDFLAYNKGGEWIGVDIGAAYDDTSIPLRLQWGEGGTYLTFPKTYTPRPSCK